MEISNISGPDMVPGGFSPQGPQREPEPESEPAPVNNRGESTDDTRGTTVDTYA